MAVKKQSFMNGVLIIMMSQVLIKIFGFVYRVVLTNFPQFGDEGNSYYGSGYQVYSLLLAIATTGIPNTISKLVSEKIAVGDKKGAHKIFKTALVVFSLIGVIFALGLFFGAGFIANNILKNPGVKYTLMSLAPAIIFVSMSAVLRGYFVGMQNMTEYSKAQIIEQIVNSVFSILFVVLLIGSTPQIMAAGSTLATTVAASSAFLYLLIYYRKNRKDIKVEVNEARDFGQDSFKKIAKKLITYAIPISFGSVVVALSGVIDLVSVMDGLQKFGYDIQTANEKFGIILGKVDILYSVPLSLNVAFSVALVPFISSAIAKGKKKEAVDKINYSLKVSSIIAFPCAVGMFVLATPIFLLIFPNASEGAPLLQIQCWGIIFSVISQTLYGSLQGLGKVYVPGACLALGAVVKYILNVTLVPKYGEIIPAISTVVYNIVAFTTSFIILFKTLKQKPNLKGIFGKTLIASIGMGIITIFAYNIMSVIGMKNSISTLVSMLVAVISYAFLVLKMKILNENEIKQLPMGNKIYKLVYKK